MRRSFSTPKWLEDRDVKNWMDAALRWQLQLVSDRTNAFNNGKRPVITLRQFVMMMLSY
jgi:hypothetical protein